ncbi:hypothetical protein [Streptomyces tremellae]|uniref:Integral membrane protein n=1 Tax=Streptomyces tremellae TaxID=1124239 RepID=A0ABP7EXX3_9ACTN
MTEPRIIPPPPTYPPTVGAAKPAPEPRIIVVTPEQPKPPKPKLLNARRIAYNTTAAAVALAPVFGGYSLATALGIALHDCRTQASLPGAWALAGGLLAATLYVDRTRSGWIARLLLATAVIGALLSLPFLDGLLYVITGVHR